MIKKLKKALGSAGSNNSLVSGVNLEDIQNKFLLQKTTFHGFPPNPTCLAHDHVWGLLFIGTSSGQIYMYGKPGLEIKTEHPDYPISFSPIQFMFSLPEQMQLVSISENNTLHVWSICDEDNKAQLIVLNQKELVQGRGKEITACSLERNNIFFGTGDGRLYEMDLLSMGITLIDWEEGESTPIVSLEICPTDRNFILCGYRNGLITLRNVKQGVFVYSVKRTEVKGDWGPCNLTSAVWQHNGDGFIGCYSTGEMAYWTVSNRGKPDYVNTFFESEYGLESITRPIWTSNDMLVFAGGVPEDLGIHSSVTLAWAREPDQLELTSPIVSPTPYSNQETKQNDTAVLKEKGRVSRTPDPIPSVVEALRASSPFSATSTLERRPKKSNRHSGFYPDTGDDTLALLKSLAIKQELGTQDFNPGEILPQEDLTLDITPPSPLKVPLTPESSEKTPNGPESDDTFLSAKTDSFDISPNELEKTSKELEQILADLTKDQGSSQNDTSPILRRVRTSGESSEQIGDITETLLKVGDFTQDEGKYNRANGSVSVDEDRVVVREKRVRIKEPSLEGETEDSADVNGDLEALDPFEHGKFNWRDSQIHEDIIPRSLSSPHESDLDEVIESIERLVSRPWVKKMNPWKNEMKQIIKFTSSIKGLFVIKQDDSTSRWLEAASPSHGIRNEILVVLLDQELLFIDLTKPDFPLIMPPYLINVHSSSVSCSLLLDYLASVQYKLLKQLGTAQIQLLYPSSAVDWPFNGGEVSEEYSEDQTVVFITGHENGTIKFWDVTGGAISLIYCLYTNYLFDLGVDRTTPLPHHESRLEGVQRGFWDQYAEDHRLKITSLCCYDAVLAVGGAGGQVLLFELTHDNVAPSVFQLEATLLAEEVRIRHRPGLQPLHFKPPHTPDKGYVPFLYFQMSPASPITSLEMAPNFNLVAVGCSYGLAVIDVEKRSVVFTYSTFEEGQIPDESHLSRRSSMRQSFRQSFRSLRRAGSGRRSRATHSSIRGRPSMRGAAGTSARGVPLTLNPAAAPAQQGNSQTVIKCLTFTTTFISGSHAQLCLWAGTSEGSVLRMSVTVPSKGNRKNRCTEVNMVGRPVYLRRASPLTRITVLDAANQVQLPVGARGVRGPHTVLMCSEDYIKILNLPGMKKKSKERLRIDENDMLRLIKTELLYVNGVTCLATLDNEGQVSVYALPDMRLLFRNPIVESTDVRAQKSFCITPSGHILSQCSQLQFQKYSLLETSRFQRVTTIGERAASPRSQESSQSVTSEKLF